MSKIKLNLPVDGLAGLKQNFSADAISGFLVFLLALPLSLGIAGASDFPPIYGLITAMIGGVLVSLISGSLLTIKGPAAGLIVIVAGSVAELGQGNNELGWQLALGAVTVAGVIQVLFGLLKFGKLSDFFPLSAVHGMLAAIGIIIISKQLHIVAGMNPVNEAGKPMVEPLELLMELKNTFANFFLHKEVTIVGLVSLLIVFGWPMIPVKFFKKIPAALVVLVVAIPLAQYLNVHNIADIKDAAGNVVKKGFSPLLEFKEGLLDILGVNVSFAGFSQTGTFIKFVIMFALVGSLESLLTVKATDMIDPFKRKSDYNKDLIAVGIGNIIAGILGGLPMISEVARSSANVNNGGKTRWANFFHGFFILLFLVFAVSFSGLIPKAALAAMLIGVGYKLAHPKEFVHTFHIGKEQLAIFLITIIFTLVEDLLIGIAAGIILNIVIHIFNGVSISYLFKSPIEVSFEGDNYLVEVDKSALFTNYLGLKSKLEAIPRGFNIVVNLKKTKMVDYSTLENIQNFKVEYESKGGGTVTVRGLSKHKPFSSHELASRKQ